MPGLLMLLCCLSPPRRGEITGISFIDSTPLRVCHPSRSKSHRVFEGLQLITKSKRKMKNRLMKMMDKIRLRKRALIESVNEPLKNICPVEYSRHRSVFNFLVNLLAGLVAYTYTDKKPALDLSVKG